MTVQRPIDYCRGTAQRGQGLVELVLLLLPLLLTILFGTIDLGRAFYTYIALTNAAREAARYAAVNDTTASITQVQRELRRGDGHQWMRGGNAYVLGNGWWGTRQCLYRECELPIHARHALHVDVFWLDRKRNHDPQYRYVCIGLSLMRPDVSEQIVTWQGPGLWSSSLLPR